MKQLLAGTKLYVLGQHMKGDRIAQYATYLFMN